METQTIENNKLIAEFIGNDTNEYGLDVFVPKSMKPITTKNNNVVMQGIFEFNECLFHNSWDWLMPVVEKIESLNLEINGVLTSFDVTISYQYCQIIDEEGLGICGINTHSKDNKSKIEAVYKAVIEFIKWYNENK